MIFNFEQYLNEGIGAITMERKPIDKLNEPDHITPRRMIHVARGSAVPRQWGNTTLSFGANPEEKNDNKMSTKSHVNSFEAFTKKNSDEALEKKAIKEREKETKKVTALEEEAPIENIIDVPDKFKSDNDEIVTLRTSINTLKQDVLNKETHLNKLIQELQVKMGQDKVAQANLQNQQQQTQQQNPQV